MSIDYESLRERAKEIDPLGINSDSIEARVGKSPLEVLHGLRPGVDNMNSDKYYRWEDATPKGEQPQTQSQPQIDNWKVDTGSKGNVRLHGDVEAEDNSSPDSSGGDGEMLDSKGERLLTEEEAKSWSWNGNTREIKGKDGKIEYQTRIPGSGRFPKDTWISTEQYNLTIQQKRNIT